MRRRGAGADGAGARGCNRTASISPDDSSLNMRMVMWQATLRMIADHPLTGVGAGAWEVRDPAVPGRRRAGRDRLLRRTTSSCSCSPKTAWSGWAFLLGAVRATCCGRPGAPGAWPAASAPAEAPWRAAALASLLALLAGEQRRISLAHGGHRRAVRALRWAVLAASDARLGLAGRWARRALPWRHAWSKRRAGASPRPASRWPLFITQQAAECEREDRAGHASSRWRSPRRATGTTRAGTAPREEVLRLTREAIAINPHYRKITPIVADELARWGDWKNATWIWESRARFAALRGGHPDQRRRAATSRMEQPRPRRWPTWSARGASRPTRRRCGRSR